MEEKYLTPGEESEAERTRRQSAKIKAVSRFNEELRLQANDEVQTVRGLTQKKRG